MKKPVLKVIGISFMMSCCLAMTPIAAQTVRPSTPHIPPSDTKLLPPDQTSSEGFKQNLGKGEVISSGTLIISNEGGGEIGILADTRAHVDVDAMYVTIYLDRYDEKADEWKNKKVYDFEFTPEDVADGKLHAMLIQFNEKKQKPDYYYRLWAYHEVVKNGEWESVRTATNGVLITK